MLTTQPYHIQRAYQQAMKEFIERYKRECRENLIDYVLLDTATPFDVALLNYLNKRQRMG
jgi:MinD-like ATPase involved in chromosome partitioning or flagellar assembly